MSIKAADVKKLRDITGAGMMECKKALVDAEGDFKQAEKLLKERGVAAASKRSDRATNEGRIFTMVSENKAGALELGCETDFVARNADFIATGEKILSSIVNDGATEVTTEMEDMVKELISQIKENMSIKRFKTMDVAANDYVASYIHGEGTIGVLVKVTAEDASALENDKVKELAFDCALHAAAFCPAYLNADAVDASYLKEQEEIFTVQAQNLGKPEKVVAGIVKGKLNKHLAEICFVDQPFVKDDKMSVQQVFDALGKELGTKITLSGSLYFRVGEEA